MGKSQRKGPGPDAGHRYGTTLLTTEFRHSPIVETSPIEPLEIRQRVWPDEVALAAAMAALASSPALRNAYIALDGDLGAGKTTLVRHLLRALGVRGRIKSPTYAVVEPHEAPGDHGPLSIWHFDFYRFADPREWEDAGFRDLFAAPGLKLAEWPDKAAGLVPPPDLTIALQVQPDDSRRATLTARGAVGRALLERL